MANKNHQKIPCEWRFSWEHSSRNGGFPSATFGDYQRVMYAFSLEVDAWARHRQQYQGMGKVGQQHQDRDRESRRGVGWRSDFRVQHESCLENHGSLATSPCTSQIELLLGAVSRAKITGAFKNPPSRRCCRGQATRSSLDR